MAIRTTKLLTSDELMTQLRGSRASIPAMRDAARRLEEFQQRIDRIRAEGAAIANALGERGLLDFADDVRMLTKL